jgi:polysaccharide pyruvyl transferase WcaK-like protein
MTLEKRKNILFVRHYGVISNVGDKLIAKATEDYVLTLSQHEDFNYSTASFVPYTKFGKYNVVNLIRGFWFSFIQGIKADHIIIIGGNLIIPNDTKFSFCFFFYFLLAKIFNGKFSTFGVGASMSKGKITWRNKLYRKALLNTDYLGIRDEHSAKALANIAGDDYSLIEDKVQVSHDCAFLSKDKYFNHSTVSENAAVIPVNYHSAMSNEKVIKLSESEYLEFHVNLLSAMIQKGMKPFFLCTDTADELFADQINQKLNLKVITPKTVEELFLLLNSVNVVAARMHGVIASLLAGNLVVALNWQHKVKSLSEKEDLSFACFEFETESISLILTALEQPNLTDRSDLIKLTDELCLNLKSVICK